MSANQAGFERGVCLVVVTTLEIHAADPAQQRGTAVRLLARMNSPDRFPITIERVVPRTRLLGHPGAVDQDLEGQLLADSNQF